MFDGGRRRARQRQAEAEWREASAHYRATVLTAFQQVEDGLARSSRLSDQVAAEDRAARSADSAARLAYERYVKGVANILDVVTAQATELDVRRRAEQARVEQLQTGASLQLACGGCGVPRGK